MNTTSGVTFYWHCAETSKSVNGPTVLQYHNAHCKDNTFKFNIMFKPELYNQSNTTPQLDGLESLEKFRRKIKWSDGDSVIDLGCGDGVLTTRILKKFLHPNFEKLVGCDVSEQMVRFANEKLREERTFFTVFDIGGKLPDDMRQNFDHAFSFYAIHWVRQQHVAFTNVYNLLKKDGDCLLVFPSYTPIHSFYRALARHPKWQYWFENVENYISPYHDSLEPEKQVRRIMEEVGFRNIDVTCTRKSYVNDLDLFKTTMEAINPFKIPSDLQNEFMEDYMQVVRDMKLIENKDDAPFVTIDYSLLVAYGRK